MSKKRNGVNWSKKQPAMSRRSRALKRLQAQLESGKKVTKDGETVELTEKDTKRIKSEIQILKERV